MNIIAYLLKVTILICVGIILANIILESNFMKRLSLLINPLSSSLNLSKGSVLCLFASFFNPTAGKSTLAGFYREGKISDKEAIATVVMSTFPIVLGEHLFVFVAPTALILLGPKIGTIYILLMLFSAFIQSFAAFIYSKFFLHPKNDTPEEMHFKLLEKGSNMMLNIQKALKKSFTTLKRVIPIMVITFLAIHFLIEFGGMDHISSVFNPALRLLDLPGECISALIGQLAHFSACYAAVAMLLAQGIVTAKQAIITLLIGSMIGITMIYARYSFSMYVSLFGKLGVKIIAISYMSSMVAKVITILLVQLFL